MTKIVTQEGFVFTPEDVVGHKEWEKGNREQDELKLEQAYDELGLLIKEAIEISRLPEGPEIMAPRCLLLNLYAYITETNRRINDRMRKIGETKKS